ncbi:MAG: ornithine carbamoyltransferase [Verrucomicrobiota bacterium]|nr:ornithine carbamoyltransferase [Verrucomicrobiota bacterium]
MKNKHLLALTDISSQNLNDIIDLGIELKKTRGQSDYMPLKGKSIGMVFTKSSTRTRISFEVGISELGGYPLFLGKNDLQLGRGENMSDTAKVMSRYLHAVVIRTHEHSGIETFAKHSEIPVINALTDKLHPCQLLADLMTIKEYSGHLENIKVAFLGDGASNMANSWIIAAKMMNMDLRIAAPEGYHPDLKIYDSAQGNGSLTVISDVSEAVKDVDYIYTDVWVSMGFEEEAKERIKILQPYQVNSKLVSLASDNVRIMHCLPAYRGKEITAEVLDGEKSIVWDEAENRLHAQKALLAKILE